jgi:hypothetical protein
VNRYSAAVFKLVPFLTTSCSPAQLLAAGTVSVFYSDHTAAMSGTSHREVVVILEYNQTIWSTAVYHVSAHCLLPSQSHHNSRMSLSRCVTNNTGECAAPWDGMLGSGTINIARLPAQQLTSCTHTDITCRRAINAVRLLSDVWHQGADPTHPPADTTPRQLLRLLGHGFATIPSFEHTQPHTHTYTYT